MFRWKGGKEGDRKQYSKVASGDSKTPFMQQKKIKTHVEMQFEHFVVIKVSSFMLKPLAIL